VLQLRRRPSETQEAPRADGWGANVRVRTHSGSLDECVSEFARDREKDGEVERKREEIEREKDGETAHFTLSRPQRARLVPHPTNDCIPCARRDAAQPV